VRPTPFLAIAALVACSRPAAPGRFVLRLAVPGILGPVRPGSDTNASAATDLVFESILSPDASGRARSTIARTFQRLGSDRYRIELDPRVRLSDGSPVEFDDVARGAAVMGVKAVRDGDAIILDSGGRPIEPLLYYSTPFREAGVHRLGTGPYRVVEEGQSRIALERVVPAPGRIQQVEIAACANDRDALARTLRGETNGVFGLEARLAEFVDGIPGLRVVRGPGPHVRVAMFNQARVSAADRRRIAGSLPWEAIARHACGDGAMPSVASMALPDGPPLSIVAFDESQPVRLALALRRALRGRGGAVQRLDVTEYLRVMSAHEFDVFVGQLLAWPPPVLALSFSRGGLFNYTNFSSPEIDAAFARGDAEAARAAIEREAVVVFLCPRERVGAFDARIRNASFGRWGVLDTLPDWEVGP